MTLDLDSRDRSRLLAVAILLAVFAAGLFAGAALSIVLRPGPGWIRHEERILRGPPALPGDHEGVVFLRTPETFDERLGLTQEQEERVERLMEDQRRKAERLMEDMEPRMKALMDSTNAAIETVLTPEQRERFREIQKERRDLIVRRFIAPAPAPPPPIE